MEIDRIRLSRSALCLALPLALSLTPLAAQQSLEISGPLFQARSGDVVAYAVSADGTRIVYLADQTTDEVRELFSVPADASAPPLRLTPPLSAGTDVGAPRIAGDRVLYLADQAIDGVYELHSVPLTGGSSVRLNGPVGLGGGVSGLWVSSDEELVVYQAVQLDSASSLFAAPSDGSAAATPLPIEVEVADVWLSPDGASLLYAVQEGVTQSLYRVPLDGSAAPVWLDRSSTDTGATPGSRACSSPTTASTSCTWTT